VSCQALKGYRAPALKTGALVTIYPFKCKELFRSLNFLIALAALWQPLSGSERRLKMKSLVLAQRKGLGAVLTQIDSKEDEPIPQIF